MYTMERYKLSWIQIPILMELKLVKQKILGERKSEHSIVFVLDSPHHNI